MTQSTMADAMDRYFRASLPLIEDVIAFHCSRGRLGPDEREDFRSWAIEKLIENDYGRLGKFQGRSSLRSFLSVVVANLLLDYWHQKGGRRRPSSMAKQFAPEGVWLERYLGDGYTLSEAVEMVRRNHESDLLEEELFYIALRLPIRRTRPKKVAESSAFELGGFEASPDRMLEARAEEASRARVEWALERSLAALPPDERVFVRMRFEDGSRINEIARAFHLEEKTFYRRFQGTLRRLRQDLAGRGVDAGCLALYEPERTPAANPRARAV